MSKLVKRVSRRVSRSSKLIGRAATCGTKFVTLLPETQHVLVQSANELPNDPLPPFLIILCQDDNERLKQCLQLEKDDDACDLMSEKKLFLIPSDAAAAVDNAGHKYLDFPEGIAEKTLFKRSEDPNSNSYFLVDGYEECMIEESAKVMKKAFELVGVESIRSRVAHTGSESAARALKFDGKVLGTGAGVEMSSKTAEDTSDASSWALKRFYTANQKFKMLPEKERYFLKKVDGGRDDGRVISWLQDIVDENKPIYASFEFKVSHSRLAEDEKTFALNVAARFHPTSKFEAITGGNLERSKAKSSSLVYERELEVTFFEEYVPPPPYYVPPKKTAPVEFVSRLVPRTHTEIAKILEPRMINNLSPRRQVSILVIGEKDAGKTSFIWTLMRAYKGLFGYPTDSPNLRPEHGMQVRVEVDLNQRTGRQDSEATILDDDFDLREGTTTDTVDIYKITETPYVPRIKTPGVTEKKIIGELKMLDTEGLQLAGNIEGDIQKSEVKALVDKWTDAQMSLHPRLIPDATVLVFDGKEILEQNENPRLKGFQTRSFRKYASLISKSRKALGTKYPVIIVLTRRDKVVEDVENKLKASASLPVDEMALQRAIDKQIFRARDIVARGLQGIEDISVFFLQNYVEPSQEEIDRMNELQNEADLDIEAQKQFILEMDGWKSINENALQSMYDLLKKVDRTAFNEYVKKKTNEGPCKMQ